MTHTKCLPILLLLDIANVDTSCFPKLCDQSESVFKFSLFLDYVALPGFNGGGRTSGAIGRQLVPYFPLLKAMGESASGGMMK